MGAAGGCSFSEVGVAISGTRRAPQFAQNTLSILLAVPHIGQIKPEGGTRRAPQLLQYLLPSRFFVPHREQLII
jgi:hypothetical protein